MRPTAHVGTSIIILKVIELTGMQLTGITWLFFVLGNVIIDVDFVVGRIIGVTNHRELVTHNLFLWMLLSVLSAFLTQFYLFGIVFWLFLGIVSHLILDLIDFGLPLVPFCQCYSPHLIEVDDAFQTEADFAKAYWTNAVIILIEFTALLTSLLILWLSTIDVKIYIGIFFILCYCYSGIEMFSILKTGGSYKED